jgi:hypothetical protein
MRISRRQLLQIAGASALSQLGGRRARAQSSGVAKRFIVFYFPDGVSARSQEGEPSDWHAAPSGGGFTLGSQLMPLDRLRSECVFFNGLSMGPTDSGSHPGGAKKLLTAADGGNNESIDHFLARTAGASSAHRHVLLGAMANQNGASGDKHVSYPSSGQTIAPEDDPRRAFDRLFGSATGAAIPSGPSLERSVIDAWLGEVEALKTSLGSTERRKLDLHLESLREVERRIATQMPAPEQCGGQPASFGSGPATSALYDPSMFPGILRMQIDLGVQALACQLTRVLVIQCSYHTSELIMSRFPGTPFSDPGFDMRSHQASHYGPRHDPNHREYRDYVAQRRWFVEQFAYLLDQLRSRPEDGGSMLDHSIALLASEVSDGNTHSHDDMPFVLAGRAGGRLRTGQLLDARGARHGDLYVSIARAMGQNIDRFGDASSGPLSGVLV